MPQAVDGAIITSRNADLQAIGSWEGRRPEAAAHVPLHARNHHGSLSASEVIPVLWPSSACSILMRRSALLADKREDLVPAFVAHVEFRLDAETLEDGGKRLRDLAKVTPVGFELIRARIEPVPPSAETDEGSGTGYGPSID
jgi:hypothetical protein